MPCPSSPSSLCRLQIMGLQPCLFDLALRILQFDNSSSPFSLMYSLYPSGACGGFCEDAAVLEDLSKTMGRNRGAQACNLGMAADQLTSSPELTRLRGGVLAVPPSNPRPLQNKLPSGVLWQWPPVTHTCRRPSFLGPKCLADKLGCDYPSSEVCT